MNGGVIVSAYTPTGEYGMSFRLTYLTASADGGYFWGSIRRYAVVFECEQEAREAASRFGEDCHFVVRRVLAESTCVS